MFRNRKKATYSTLGEKTSVEGGGGGGGGGERRLDSRARRSVGRERGESMLDEDTAMWKEGETSFMEAQKGKKILFERVFSHNKKINAVTEVKENHYLLLAASGIKSLQKQTARNNCLVCITDTLNINVRLRAKEIRFAQLKEGKPLMLFIES